MRFFQNIKKFHGYAVYAAKAQLKSEVASSYLNWIWWILEPLCTMLIYIIVFGYIFEASEDNYTVFLFLGILMWNFFSGVVGSSVSVVKNNQDIISRVYVPKYILLISLMYQYAFRFVFGMSIEIIMMLVFRLKFGWYMISAIPFLLGFFLFTFSCSTILVHFGVYVYDLTYVVGIILNFVMGRENIYIAGLLLGFSQKEIRSREQEIIDFAELEYFIDMPVRTYSSGMYSRLGFAITATLETDIVLIDEVLSVGDERFQKKSYKKMQQLISNKEKTVIICSHSRAVLGDLCSEILWLDDGKIVEFGSTEAVLEKYHKYMRE